MHNSNYRGLKKCIKQIIKSRAGLPHSSTVSLGNGSQPDIPRRSASASILDSPVLNTRTHYGSVGNTPPISTALRPSSPPNLTLSPSALGDRSSVDMRNNGPSSLRTFRSEIPVS